MLGPVCIEVPHLTFGYACSTCLSDYRAGSCTSCLLLHFDCTCACGPHAPSWLGVPIYEAQQTHAKLQKQAEIELPDSYRWSFFRPFSGSGDGLIRSSNLSGFESDNVLAAAYRSWHDTRFPLALRQKVPPGRGAAAATAAATMALRGAQRIGGFLRSRLSAASATRAVGRSQKMRVALRSMPAVLGSGRARLAARPDGKTQQVLIIDPCAPTGRPGGGMVQCFGGRVPGLMHLDLHTQLSRAARSMGLSPVALVLAEPSPRALRHLLHEFDRVFVWHQERSSSYQYIVRTHPPAHPPPMPAINHPPAASRWLPVSLTGPAQSCTFCRFRRLLASSG